MLFDFKPEHMRVLFQKEDLSDAMIKSVRHAQKNMTFLNSPLFKAAEKANIKRPKISELEAEVTKHFMQRFLVGRSGSMSATHYTELDKEDLIGIYKDRYDEVVKQCGARGTELKHTPRSYHVLYRILKELHVVKIKQAKHCRWFQDAITIDGDVNLIKMELAL